jgi:hypothetical protein
MILSTVLAALVSFSLFACGVRNELRPPMSGRPEKRRLDPFTPPRPLGQ